RSRGRSRRARSRRSCRPSGTSMLRGSRLNVVDEVANGLSYYNYVFLRELPRFYAALEDQLASAESTARSAAAERSRLSMFRQYKRISTQHYGDGRKDNSRCKLRDLFYFWCGLLLAWRRRQRRWLLGWMRR